MDPVYFPYVQRINYKKKSADKEKYCSSLGGQQWNCIVSISELLNNQI